MPEQALVPERVRGCRSRLLEQAPAPEQVREPDLVLALAPERVRAPDAGVGAAAVEAATVMENVGR